MRTFYYIMCVYILCFPVRRMKDSVTKGFIKKTGSVNRVYVEEIFVHYGMQIDSVYKTFRSENILFHSVFTKYLFFPSFFLGNFAL